MGLETKDGAGITPQPFEDTVAVEQPVVKDADAGFILRHEPVVHENQARHV